MSSGLSPESGASKDHLPAARYARAAGEVVVCFLASVIVWGFAGDDPIWRVFAAVGITLLLATWLVHTVITGHFSFRFDFVTVCLSGLCLLSLAQLVPLPVAIVRLVAPTSANLHTTLRPDTSELLPGETAAVARSSMVPISVNPYATKIFAGEVLALLLVYVAVRNWLAGRDAIRRFAWVCCINGLALAVFAMGQFFSTQSASASKKFYWTFASDGALYGPFGCRNHYIDYIALCLGLTLGLLLQKRDDGVLGSTAGLKWWDRVQLFLAAPGQLLSEPRTLIPTLALGLMLVSIPFSLSRGGIIAFVLAAPLTWVLVRRPSKKKKDETATPVQFHWALVISATIAGILAIWFGGEHIGKRFSTTNQSDNRTEIWASGLSSAPGFWLTGSGGGTHRWVEPLGRTTEDPRIYHDHAHNEYVEALIEGGPIRLALTVGLAVGLLRIVGRGYRERRERRTGPLLLGGWIGIIVVVVHAAVDFGIHMPAVALLTVIVAAYTTAAAIDPEYSPTKRRHQVKRKSGRSSSSRSESTRSLPAPASPRPAPVSPTVPAPASAPVVAPVAAAVEKTIEKVAEVVPALVAPAAKKPIEAERISIGSAPPEPADEPDISMSAFSIFATPIYSTPVADAPKADAPRAPARSFNVPIADIAHTPAAPVATASAKAAPPANMNGTAAPTVQEKSAPPQQTVPPATAATPVIAATHNGEVHVSHNGAASDDSSRKRSGYGNEPDPASGISTFSGAMAIGMMSFALLLSIILLLDARNRRSAHWYKKSAEVFGREIGPERHLNRIPYLEDRVNVRPSDPEGHIDLARAHLGAANDLAAIAAAAVIGTALPQELPVNKYPKDILDKHLYPALRALRTARDLSPVYPEGQAHLGLYAGFFQKSDKPLQYLERALRLLPSDGAMATDAGSEAWRTGDQATAIQYWKRALQTSDKQVRPVLLAVGTKLLPERLRKEVLPANDPVVMIEAADVIYPLSETMSVQERSQQLQLRRPFLMGAIDSKDHQKRTVAQFEALARAYAEMEQPDNAVEMYRQAVATDSGRIDLRDRFAYYLESEERYTEALEHLDWMRNNHPASVGNLQQRIQAAQRGEQLFKIIQGHEK